MIATELGGSFRNCQIDIIVRILRAG